MKTKKDQPLEGEVVREGEMGKRKQMERLAWLLDSSFTIPGTNIRTGLDGIIGLVPGIGDLIGAALSSYIVMEAARMGVSKAVLARMGLNVFIETVIGAVPVFGDLFDIAFKANNRNVRLVNRYLEKPNSVKRRSGLEVGLAAIVFLGLMVLVIAGVAALLGALFSALSAG